MSEESTDPGIVAESVVVDTGKVYKVVADPIPKLRFRLFDGARKAMPNSTYQVNFGGGSAIEGTSDGEGRADVELPAFCPIKVTIRWGEHAFLNFAFTHDIFPDCSSGDQRQLLIARLTNLGYSAELDLDAAVRAFQFDYQVDAAPSPVGLLGEELPPASQAKLEAIYGEPLDAATQVPPSEDDENADEADLDHSDLDEEV
jgi:hypothetical protein